MYIEYIAHAMYRVDGGTVNTEHDTIYIYINTVYIIYPHIRAVVSVLLDC